MEQERFIHMVGSFHLQLLGPIRIEQPNGIARHIDSRKGIALLAYVARHERPLSREHLADLFWGEKSTARARRNLSRELSEINAVLPGCLQADYHTIHISRSVSIDTALFRALTADPSQATAPRAFDRDQPLERWFARRARASVDIVQLTKAVALYRGDFLAGFYLDGCAEFETWLVLERELWRRTMTDALEQLIVHHALRCEDDQAQHYARHCLAIEPWHEEAHHALMLLLARNGKRNAALAQFQICQQALADELGIEPTEETVVLYEQIRSGTLSDIRASGHDEAPNKRAIPASPPAQLSAARQDFVPDVHNFYGRGAELLTLQSWLVAERCRLVAILGMGGIGKTALAARLAGEAAPHYDIIIWHSLLNAPPLADILRASVARLSKYQQTDLPERLDDQLVLLITLLRQRRCMLILDNCESILLAGTRAGSYRPGYENYGQLLQQVGANVHQSCVVLTSREQPQGLELLLGETTQVRSLVLRGLGDEAGQTILHAHGLCNLAQHTSHLIERYSGNPLALHIVAETVKDLFGGDLAAFLCEETLIFDDIRDILDQQWDRLTKLEQDILFWLAIEREDVGAAVLRANLIDGNTGSALLDALRSLRRRSLVELQDKGFTMQNVIMEYVTNRFLQVVRQEVIQGRWERFQSHALIKAQAKEYVRETQIRLILAPLAEQIVARLGRRGTEQLLRDGLAKLRAQSPRSPGYAGGNVLNLLVHLGADLEGYDFSELCVWQAYLQPARLLSTNFAHADFSNSTFNDAFRSQNALAWSHDGEYLAVAAGDGAIHIWQLANRQLVGICRGGAGYTHALIFSPDSTLLACAGTDLMVRVWDVRSCQLIHTLQGHSRVIQALAWDPDGATIFSGSVDTTIRAWQLPSGHTTIIGAHLNEIHALAISPDGRTLASGGFDGHVMLWECQRDSSGTTMQLMPTRRFEHNELVFAVALSRDGWLAIGGYRGVRVWDTNTGALLAVLPLPDQNVRSLAFSPDDTWLTSSGLAVHIWDTNTWKLWKALHGHSHPSARVAWNPNNLYLASLGGDLVQIWDPQRGQAITTLRGHSDEVLGVAFSPDGTSAASSHVDDRICIWDTATWQVRRTLRGHQGWTRDVRFHPNGTMLVSAGFDQTVRLWDYRSGEALRVLHGHHRWIDSLAISPDGSLIATSSYDQTIWFWETASGRTVRVLRGHTDIVTELAFNPEGTLLVSGSEDSTVRLWDVQTGEMLAVLEGHVNTVLTVLFDQSGRMLISGGNDQMVRLWDVQSGQQLRMMVGHTSMICEVRLSPDGMTLATCGSGDQTVRLWDLYSGELLHVLEHGVWVVSIAFSPDGKTLISGSEDGKLRLWNVITGALIRVWRAPGPYAGMNITGVTGVTEAQKMALQSLGAVESRSA